MDSREMLHSSESKEWYTPLEYIEMAREVMGSIDLDPASCNEAQTWILARRFFTIEDDGLTEPWNGNIFLNPPYGRNENHKSNQGVWTAKLLEEYGAFRVNQAILLVNATPDRQWFHELWQFPICFCYKRIRFLAPYGGKPKSPTHPNVFVYLPTRSSPYTGAASFHYGVRRFYQVFKKIGHIVSPFQEYL